MKKIKPYQLIVIILALFFVGTKPYSATEITQVSTSEATIFKSEDQESESTEASQEVDSQKTEESQTPNGKGAKGNILVDADPSEWGTLGDIPFEEKLGTAEEMPYLTEDYRLYENLPEPFYTDEATGREYNMAFGAVYNNRSSTNYSPIEKDTLYKSMPLDSLELDITNANIKSLTFSDPGLNGPHIAIRSKSKWMVNSFYLGNQIGNYEGGSGFYQGMDVEGKAMSRNQGVFPRLLKLYRIPGQALIGFGVELYNGKVTALIKVKMQVNKKQRVIFTSDYYSTSAEEKTLYTAYGHHLDIDGYHEESLLYTLGNYRGYYFAQPTTSDKHPYYLSFYKNTTSHPAEFQMHTENGDKFVFSLNGDTQTQQKVPLLINKWASTPDKPKDTQISGPSYIAHPAIAFVWPETKMSEPGEVQSVSFEQSITSVIPQVVLNLTKEMYDSTTDETIDQTKMGETVNFRVRLESDSLLRAPQFVDTIPEGLTNIRNIKVTMGNQTVSYDTKDVYDESARELTLSLLTLYGGKVLITYEADVLKGAAYEQQSEVSFSAVNEEDGPENVKSQHLFHVEQPKIGNVTIKYHNSENTEIAESKKVSGEVGEAYKLEPTDYQQIIEGYQFKELQGDSEGLFTEEDQTVTYIYEDKMFDVKKAVYFNNKELAITVARGDELTYETTLTSLLEKKSPQVSYKQFVITIDVDSNLENIRNLKLVTETGDVAGKLTHNTGTNQIIGEINPSIGQENNIRLAYQGDVKQTVQVGNVIKAKAVVTGEYSDGKKPLPKTSNEVSSVVGEGTVIINEIPSALSFGEIIFEPGSKKIVNPSVAGKLEVKDTRVTGNGQWSINAKMKKKLTSKKGEILEKALRYSTKGVEKVLNENTQVVYTNQESSATGIYDVTKTWGAQVKADGVKLYLESNATVYSGDYEGEITWEIIPDQP